jgi:hypothetical protein
MSRKWLLSEGYSGHGAAKMGGTVRKGSRVKLGGGNKIERIHL